MAARSDSYEPTGAIISISLRLKLIFIHSLFRGNG